MRLVEMYTQLYEATPNQIFKNYNDKIVAKWNNEEVTEIQDAREVVDMMTAIAPDNAVNTYILWIYKQWMSGNLDLDDGEKIKKYLTVFEKERRAGNTAKKDPMQYGFDELISEIQDTVEAHEEKEREEAERKAEIQRVQDEGELETVYKDEKLEILKPNTFSACKHFGKEGSWCVSTDEHHWDNYAERGEFYIINIAANPETGERKRKFGVHIEGGEWQNEQNERLPDEEIKELVDEYPQIRDVLKHEAEEHGFEPVLGDDWVNENPRRYAEKAVEKWEDSDNGAYGFEDIQRIAYQQDREWDKAFAEEVARIASTDTAIPLLKVCGIRSDILVDEAIDKGFDYDFFRVMEEEYGLSDEDYERIYKENPDLITDALSFNELDMLTLYSEIDRDLLNDMLRNSHYFAEHFFEPYEEEWIDDPENDALVQSLLNAMSSSGENYERGLEALDNLDDVGAEIKETWKDELMQVRKDVIGTRDGLNAIMSRGEEVSKEDMLNSLTKNPQNLHVLERHKIPITHNVAKHAIMGDPNFAVEWLFNKRYNISSSLAKMALENWEEGRSDESVKDKLLSIAGNEELFPDAR